MGKPSYKKIDDTSDNGASQNLRREKAAANTGLAHRIIHALDMLDLTGIFVMNGFDFMKLIFEHLARYIMLPVAAASTLVMSILAWVEYGLSKDKDVKGFLLGKAVTETIGAGAINAAVIGSLVSAGFFVGPYLFAGYLGYKALFHLGAAIFFSHKAYKAHKAGDKKKYEKFKGRMIDTWTGFVVGALATATVITVVIFLQSAFWVMGAVAVGIGAAITIFKIAQNIYQRTNTPRKTQIVVDHFAPVPNLDDLEHQKKKGASAKEITVGLLQDQDTEYTEAHAHSASNAALPLVGADKTNSAFTVDSSSSGDESELLKARPSSSSGDDDDLLTRSQVGINTTDLTATDPAATPSALGHFGKSSTVINDDKTPEQDERDNAVLNSSSRINSSERLTFL